MYRFVSCLAQPFVAATLLAMLGVAALWWRRRETRLRLLWVTVPLVAMAIASTPCAAYLALGSLEWQYPPSHDMPQGVETIVVLSGYVRLPDGVRQRTELADDTLGRCLHAVDLYRQAKPRQSKRCLVVLSGGKVNPSQAEPTLAEAMRDFMIGQGVDPSDLLLENRSRSTHENAVETGRLLQQRGIEKVVLVTTASHLQRAQRCFRAQGLDVVPSGCRYRATRFQWSLSWFLPNPGSAEDVQAAAHEWLGLFWYWLHGRL